MMRQDDVIAEARRLILLTGSAGAGRVRYGAAMQLWAAGQMEAEEVETYRVASPHDGGTVAALPAGEAIDRLIEEAAIYLAGLPGPGVAEVRAGVARFMAPARPGAARANPVVARWLAPALAAMDRPSLAAAIAGAAAHLDWVTYDAYPPDRIGPAFPGGHAFASLIGESGPVRATDFELGLFLIAPGVFYRDHRHAAPELYAPLTGPHRWRFRPGAPLVERSAHVPVWNPPFQPHATKVGAVPFLCLFGWTRDVNQPAEVLDAPDWAGIEGEP